MLFSISFISEDNSCFTANYFLLDCNNTFRQRLAYEYFSVQIDLFFCAKRNSVVSVKSGTECGTVIYYQPIREELDINSRHFENYTGDLKYFDPKIHPKNNIFVLFI